MSKTELKWYTVAIRPMKTKAPTAYVAAEDVIDELLNQRADDGEGVNCEVTDVATGEVERVTVGGDEEDDE